MTEETVFKKEKTGGAGQARALGLFLLKRYEEAVAVYDELLEKEPDNIDFWLNRMVCRLQYSSPNAAFFDKMIDKVRRLPSAGYLCLAEVLNDLGRQEEALVFVNKALERDARNVGAYVLKASLLLDLERFDVLYDLMRLVYSWFKDDERVLCMAALYASTFGNDRQAWYLLKKALKRNRWFVSQDRMFYYVLLSIGKEEDVLEFAADALDVRQDNPAVWYALARSESAIGEDGDADRAFGVLAGLTDLSDEMKRQWLQVLMNLGEYPRAFDLLFSVYRDTDEDWMLLQDFFDGAQAAGFSEECRGYAEQFKERYKKSAETRFICDAAAGKDRNEGKPLSLVRAVSDFNADVMQAVSSDESYTLPLFVAQVLKTAEDGILKSKDVLDLGCGTGAMAPVLEKYSRPEGTLTGVDLSAEVLNYAGCSGKYAELKEADLVSFCRDRENAKRYDLIVCADVLFDFADLTPVFKAVKSALKDGGLFVFSVLPLRDDSLFFKFESGLFYHNAEYVSARLKSVRLQEECRSEGSVYRDSDSCLIFAARRKK